MIDIYLVGRYARAYLVYLFYVIFLVKNENNKELHCPRFQIKITWITMADLMNYIYLLCRRLSSVILNDYRFLNILFFNNNLLTNNFH